MKKFLTVCLAVLVLPALLMAANEGEGTASVDPNAVVSSTETNTLTFTINKGATSYNQGYVAITIAAGWTAPSLISSNDGYFTFSMGGDGVVSAAAVTDQLIVFSVTSWTTGAFTVVYGDKSGGGGGAHAPAAETSTFNVGTDPDATYSCIDIAANPEVLVEDPTATPSVTQTITETVTKTVTETDTETPTVTETITETVTETITETITQTVTKTDTLTVTKTVTQTSTKTNTQSVTQTVTKTFTRTITPSVTQTVTPTVTQVPLGGGVSIVNTGTLTGSMYVVSSAPCYLDKAIIGTSAPTGVTIQVYNASTVGSAASSNYQFSIYVSENSKHSLDMIYGKIGPNRQFNRYDPTYSVPYFANGIVISPTTATQAEGLFYLLK